MLMHDNPVVAALFEQLRSEEHTSELQSPCNLVCRLLLEKKKTYHDSPASDAALVAPRPPLNRTTTAPLLSVTAMELVDAATSLSCPQLTSRPDLSVHLPP